jgi:anaerobic selenocysteine-containing dehydrogenase
LEFKNDLGKPWRFEEDGFTVTRGSVWSPPGCHPVGCGVKFYVDENGVLDHLEGDENNPVTNGRLCPRCLAMKQYIYNPTRIIHPMKRAREDRGLDKWEQISWDEAYTLVGEKIKYFTENYGAESIVQLTGTGREGGTVSHWVGHRVLGTPNVCYTQSGFACYDPRSCSTQFALGIGFPEIDYAAGLEGTYDNPDYEVPEVIVLWGKEPTASNGDGLFGHAITDLMKRGAKLISVDPRVNWMASRATIHLRLRPGTDCALAMGMLNIMITEELYDKEFVELWCYGFDELAERVSEMSPERAADICGLAVEDIYEATRLYAKAKPASIAWGLALDQQGPNAVQAGFCVVALMAISGNLDVPGGQLCGVDVDAQTYVNHYGWEVMPEETRNATIGIKEYPYYVKAILNAHADLMLETLETGRPYKIRMVMVQANNVLPCNSAQPRRWHDALVNTEWGFGTDLFITPTIQACCEVFLPLATVAEKAGINATHYSLAEVTFGAENKCITVGECKGDEEYMFELGKRVRPELWEMFDTYEDVITEARTGGRITYGDLQKEVYHQRGGHYYKYKSGNLRPDRQPGFNTRTGRVELWSYEFNFYGDDPLPYYEEPPFSPVSTPELFKEYPFILTTGARTYAFFHSEHRQIPWLRELNPNPLVEIHPDDARELGVSNGQWVEISNQLGNARYKAKVTPTVFRGLVMAQHGWWFPEQDAEEPSLFGVWQSNCNDLLPTGRNGKLGYGAPMKCGHCKVTPLKENYDVDMTAFDARFGKLAI